MGYQEKLARGLKLRETPGPSILSASSLKPQASSLKPQASSLKPQASSLKPQASSLKPQASSLKPQASRIGRESGLRPDLGRRNDHGPARPGGVLRLFGGPKGRFASPGGEYQRIPHRQA